MKTMKLFQVIFLIGALFTMSCKKDNLLEPPVISHLYSDYQVMDEEFDGLLNLGEVHIDTNRSLETSARATLINRGIDVWQKITRTKYVHYKEKVIDEISGIYKFDCSGFVQSIIIKVSLLNHANDLSNMQPILHPMDSLSGVRAWTFYDYFRDYIITGNNTTGQNQYWKVFMSVDSLKKGDLIIVRYDDDWRSDWKHYLHSLNKDSSVSTGHVMIAWEIGNVDQNNEVDIQVYDCSGSGHSSDTRIHNSKPIAEKIPNFNGDLVNSGIGFGKMTYKISTNGHRRPYAYKWKLNTSSNTSPWYNLTEGDDIDEPGIKYDRIKGIIFARPI